MSDVLLTEHVDNVLVLTLNRPEARNALSPELIGAISDSLKQAADDDSVRLERRLVSQRPPGGSVRRRGIVRKRRCCGYARRRAGARTG